MSSKSWERLGKLRASTDAVDKLVPWLGCGDGIGAQLFGDRPVIANTVGCSIQGGPTTSSPHAVDSKGEGAAGDAADLGFEAFKLPHNYLAKQVKDALGDKTVMVSGADVMRKDQMQDLLL